MGNTSGQGRQFSEGLKRNHSFLQETGEEIWSVEAGDPRLLQKAGDKETIETQGTSDRGMPFVSEANRDQQETPQRIYFHSHNRKGNRAVNGKMPLPSPNAERQGIGR